MSEKIEFLVHLSSNSATHKDGCWTSRDDTKIPGGLYRAELTLIEPEPLPCPFCGGEAELICDSPHSRQETYQVRCTDCKIARTAYRILKADAVADWNRRAE